MLDKLHPNTLISKKPPSFGTLNSAVRVNEMKRIWSENQKILRSIHTTKTHYPINDLKKNANKQNYLKKIISYNSSNSFCHYSDLDRFERNNFFIKLNKHSSLLTNEN